MNLLIRVFLVAAVLCTHSVTRSQEVESTAAQREAAAATAAAERERIGARDAALDEARNADSSELAAARRKVEAARAELELVTQELARVSADQYGQLAQRYGMDRNFIRAGRPLLGLNIANDDDGVRVIGVSPGGPGAQAGMEIGDLIVELDGLDVSGSADGNPTKIFLDKLSQVEPGDEVEVALLRDGEPVELTIETSQRDIPFWFGDVDVTDRVNREYQRVNIAPVGRNRNIAYIGQPAFVSRRWNDMQLVELTPELGEYFGTEEGLLVVRAPDDEDIDLRDGDVILQIGERTPQSVGHAMRILSSFEPAEMLEVTIMREQRRRTVELAR